LKEVLEGEGEKGGGRESHFEVNSLNV